MQFDLTRPCGNCPFKTRPYFPLHPGRRQEIADSLLNGGSFACHKTTGEDDEGDACETPDSKFCAGALITLAKQGDLYAPQMVRIAARLKLFDESKLNLKAPVYDSLDAFVEDQR